MLHINFKQIMETVEELHAKAHPIAEKGFVQQNREH
jgi:hypothetical protein